MRRNLKLILVLSCLLASALYFGWAVSAQQGGSYSNPIQGGLTLVDAGTCSTLGSFVWQHLPSTAGTTTLNLSGTFTATVTVRESNNGGATWATAASNGTLTTTGTTTYNTNGFTDFCVDVTAFTSGTVGVSVSTGLIVTGVVGGSTPPGGSNTQVQYNNNGAFGGISGSTVSGGSFTLGSGSITTLSGFASGGTFGGNGAIAQFATYTSPTNCTSSASPAVCGANSNGSVVIAAAATTVTVNTTAVTASSQILLNRDDSLGTKLSVTCNTATVMGEMKVSARTAGTSFVITVQTAPVTNPGCISYMIVN